MVGGGGGECMHNVPESSCADDGLSYWCGSAAPAATSSPTLAPVPLTSADCATYNNNAGCAGCLVPAQSSNHQPHCWLPADGATEDLCDPSYGDVWCGSSADAAE